MFEAFDLSPKYHSTSTFWETHDYMYTYKNPLAPLVKKEPLLNIYIVIVTITRNTYHFTLSVHTM